MVLFGNRSFTIKYLDTFTVIATINFMRQIDHIVYSVFDLDIAISDIEKKLGVEPSFGGYHPTFGTKNALINLDNGMYLELLASDQNNTEVKHHRWMGVDLLTKNQITRWALKSSNLEKDSLPLKKYNSKMGSIGGGSRNTIRGSLLQWEMVLPLPAPEVELVPFMVDWSNSETHPHNELPNMNCALLELFGTHPNPDLFTDIFQTLGLKFRIEQSEEISLKLCLNCPKGVVEI